MKRFSLIVLTLCFPFVSACDIDEESEELELRASRADRAPWADVYILATGNPTPAGRISLSGTWGGSGGYCAVGPSLDPVPANYSDSGMWSLMQYGCGIKHSASGPGVTAICETLTQPGREVNEIVISGLLQTTIHPATPGSTTWSVMFDPLDYAYNAGTVDVECEFTD